MIAPAVIVLALAGLLIFGLVLVKSKRDSSENKNI
jgi:hypothetical protein